MTEAVAGAAPKERAATSKGRSATPKERSATNRGVRILGHAIRTEPRIFAGALTGSALLSSYQYEQARMHARVIDDSLSADRPEVAGRIAALAPSHSATSTLGANALASSAAGQANILGFLDTFRLVTVISLVGAIVVAGAALRAAITRRSKERHAG